LEPVQELPLYAARVTRVRSPVQIREVDRERARARPGSAVRERAVGIVPDAAAPGNVRLQVGLGEPELVEEAVLDDVGLVVLILGPALQVTSTDVPNL
jgi:hypothetical protein